jgi:hypothetical protein
MELIGKKIRILETNSLLLDLSGKVGIISDYSDDSISVEIEDIPVIITLYKGEYELLV